MKSNANSPTTYISASAHIDGTLTSEGDLHIAGKFDGSIACEGEVHIMGGAVCKAVIRAARVRVDGYVEGDVKALDHIDISEQGVLAGSVGCPRIAVAEGANLNGRCSIDNRKPDVQPLKEAAASARKRKSDSPNTASAGAIPRETGRANGSNGSNGSKVATRKVAKQPKRGVSAARVVQNS